jgi:hypothetical protein
VIATHEHKGDFKECGEIFTRIASSKRSKRLFRLARRNGWRYKLPTCSISSTTGERQPGYTDFICN